MFGNDSKKVAAFETNLLWLSQAAVSFVQAVQATPIGKWLNWTLPPYPPESVENPKITVDNQR